MKIDQEFLRNNVKKLKWQDDIDYKEIAVDLLNMNVNAFYNFVKGYKELGAERSKLLYDYIVNIID